MVDLLHSVLQLAVEGISIGHDDYRIDNWLAFVGSQLDQVVRCLSYGRGFTRSCAMFTQIRMARAVLLGVCNKGIGRVKLMKLREDQVFLDRPVAFQVHHILLLKYTKLWNIRRKASELQIFSQKYATGYSPSSRGGLPP